MLCPCCIVLSSCSLTPLSCHPTGMDHQLHSWPPPGMDHQLHSCHPPGMDHQLHSCHPTGMDDQLHSSSQPGASRRTNTFPTSLDNFPNFHQLSHQTGTTLSCSLARRAVPSAPHAEKPRARSTDQLAQRSFAPWPPTNQKLCSSWRYRRQPPRHWLHCGAALCSEPCPASQHCTVEPPANHKLAIRAAVRQVKKSPPSLDRYRTSAGLPSFCHTEMPASTASTGHKLPALHGAGHCQTAPTTDPCCSAPTAALAGSWRLSPPHSVTAPSGAPSLATARLQPPPGDTAGCEESGACRPGTLSAYASLSMHQLLHLRIVQWVELQLGISQPLLGSKQLLLR